MVNAIAEKMRSGIVAVLVCGRIGGHGDGVMDDSPTGKTSLVQMHCRLCFRLARGKSGLPVLAGKFVLVCCWRFIDGQMARSVRGWCCVVVRWLGGWLAGGQLTGVC